MSGEGQKYTYFGQLNNIVLVADTNEVFEQREQQKKRRAQESRA
ncbi:MAG: glycine/sarcosine/betaine reductase component B subunit [[Clostridium] symbiosum]